MKPQSFFHIKQSAGRHIAHLTFWFMVALSIGFFAGWIDLSHDDELFLALMCAISATVMITPWLLAGFVKPFDKISLNGLAKIELYLALMIILSWVGSLGMYRAEIGYDTFTHFLNSALIALITIVLIRSIAPRLIESKYLTLFIIFLAVLISGIATEIFEWGGDKLIGTMMYGEIGDPLDTYKDMIANLVGFAVGSTAGLKYKKLI